MNTSSEEERTVVGLIGDEESVASFLLAGWGQRRNDIDLKCNWVSVNQKTSTEELKELWQGLIRSKRLAVILVSGSVVLRLGTLIDELSGPPTIVALPNANSPPRVTCSVYEPYAGWRSGLKEKPLSASEELSSAITNTFCGNAFSSSSLTSGGGGAASNSTEMKEKEQRPKEEIDQEIKIDRGRGFRVDALVDAVFRLATLDVANEEDEELFRDVQPGWDGSINPTSRRRRSSGSASAARGFKLQVLNAATTELAEILQVSPRGAKHFVRALNRQRTRMVDVGAAFPFLAGLSLTVLDKCMTTSDVDTILTAMMLAQSFYRTRENDDPRPEDEGDKKEKTNKQSQAKSSMQHPSREYLKSAIQSHPVWADVAFWRDALAVCVDKQRRDFSHQPGEKPRPPPSPLSPSSASSTPLYALCLPIGLRPDYSQANAEQQIALWSQLGGIVHAMLEFGLDYKQVRSFVDLISDEHNLAEPHRAAILDHVNQVEQRGNATSFSSKSSSGGIGGFFSSMASSSPSTPVLTTPTKEAAVAPVTPTPTTA